MLFSERIGKRIPNKIIQIESIDEDLKNSLWNALTLFYWVKFSNGSYQNIIGSNLEDLFTRLWLHFFKKPIDEMEIYFPNERQNLKKYFFNAQWYDAYSFIEFVAHNGPTLVKEQFIGITNVYMARENSAYRFVSGKICEITSEEEIKEIESAIESCQPYAGVKIHLESAISLLSDKENPNYRNSIKESVSAVESLCKEITGKGKTTLGEALKLLETSGEIHPALKSAFSAIYGYTSDADGIRHALMEEETLTKADARFMLISCSAFVNYIIEKISCRPRT